MCETGLFYCLGNYLQFNDSQHLISVLDWTGIHLIMRGLIWNTDLNIHMRKQ